MHSPGHIHASSFHANVIDFSGRSLVVGITLYSLWPSGTLCVCAHQGMYEFALSMRIFFRSAEDSYSEMILTSDCPSLWSQELITDFVESKETEPHNAIAFEVIGLESEVNMDV